MPDPAPVRREDFPHWIEDAIRYNDTDRQGHVNNAVFATLCESGRVAFLHRPGMPPLPPGHSVVLARLELDYLGELFWPEVVAIGTRALPPGRASVLLEQVILRGDTCVARARSTVVLVDDATRRSSPWPEDMRSGLLG